MIAYFSRSSRSQAPAWERGLGSSSFPKPRQARAYRAWFTTWTLATSGKEPRL
jgi:hypothetical protein